MLQVALLLTREKSGPIKCIFDAHMVSLTAFSFHSIPWWVKTRWRVSIYHNRCMRLIIILMSLNKIEIMLIETSFFFLTWVVTPTIFFAYLFVHIYHIYTEFWDLLCACYPLRIELCFHLYYLPEYRCMFACIFQVTLQHYLGVSNIGKCDYNGFQVFLRDKFLAVSDKERV